MLKQVFLCAMLACAPLAMSAQQPPMGGGPPPNGQPPQSPQRHIETTFSGKTVAIDYSSPRVRGREGKIFTKDGLISGNPHYPVWRAGANAATTLKTDANLTIGSLNVPAGTYTLFVDISDPAKWVLIVSKDTGEWGLSYDSTKDLGRVPMTTSKPPAMVENLEYKLTDNGGSKGTLALTWEDVSASVQFTVH